MCVSLVGVGDLVLCEIQGVLGLWFLGVWGPRVRDLVGGDPQGFKGYGMECF